MVMPAPASQIAAAKSRGQFARPQFAFADPRRVIAEDVAHSGVEPRFYCFGEWGGGVSTVRFAHRDATIRIFGAGHWRKGKRIYEEANRLHR